MIFDKINEKYRSQVYGRADDNGCVFYFSSEDFEGLKKEPYTFPSVDGHTLSGGFYYYEGFDETRLVLFEHGMGSGHRGYMREIEALAKHGYKVFSYDHTGCMESGGKETGGFVQSLKDLNDALNALKADEKYNKLDFSVVGHSWGAFSTMNICALHPDVSHIVAMSGYISVKDVLKQFLGPFYKKIYEKEERANPDFINYNAITSLESSNVKALIISSDDDKTINCKKHFDVLKGKLGDRKNITFLKLTGKNHNPNYTYDAVRYMEDFFKKYSRALKKKALVEEAAKNNFKQQFDWERMTRQDEELWKIIFEHLDK